jgi:hypothetical protein
MAYVYRHIRLDKNEPFYIGIGKLPNYKRAFEKQKRNQFWQNIVAKTDYEVEILFDDISWEEAEKKEIEFISLYGKRDNGTGCLVNISNGGGGTKGFKHSEEAKKKISLASKNMVRKPISEETKQKIRETLTGRIGSNKGFKHSNETKEKLRLHNLGKVGPNKGKIMSEETKQKIRDTKKLNPTCRKNTKTTEETKEKIRKSLIKYYEQKKLRND